MSKTKSNAAIQFSTIKSNILSKFNTTFQPVSEQSKSKINETNNPFINYADFGINEPNDPAIVNIKIKQKSDYILLDLCNNLQMIKPPSKQQLKLKDFHHNNPMSNQSLMTLAKKDENTINRSVSAGHFTKTNQNTTETTFNETNLDMVSQNDSVDNPKSINFALPFPKDSTFNKSTDKTIRNEHKGISLFNVDFLSRNKKKEKKELKVNRSKPKKNYISKNLSIVSQESDKLNSSNLISFNGSIDTIQSSNEHKEDNDDPIYFIDESDPKEISTDLLSESVTDNLSQNKANNSPNFDTYSIQPESIIDLKKSKEIESSSTITSDSSDFDESDTEDNDSYGPIKVNIRIKPKTEIKETKNDDVLREISKNLQLVKLSNQVDFNKQSVKHKPYHYSYGTSNKNTIQLTNSQKTNEEIAKPSQIIPTIKIENSLNSSKVAKKTNQANLYYVAEYHNDSFHTDLKTCKNYVSSPFIDTTESDQKNKTESNNLLTSSYSTRTSNLLLNTASVSPIFRNAIIPIAIAFNETIHAYFKTGYVEKVKVKCFGCMKISFPSSILKYLNTGLPQFEFQLDNFLIDKEELKVNTNLLSRVDQDFKFKFTTDNLILELKKEYEQNKAAVFYNFDLLKYELSYSRVPLILNAIWTHNPIDNTIELNLDYKFDFYRNLTQVNFMVVMPSDQIALIESEPNALVKETNNKLEIVWQLPEINANGNIIAKFSFKDKLLNGNSLEDFNQPIYAKFNIENDTLSQVKLKMLSKNYKLSFFKENIVAGKYFCSI